jgi:hypothetical protein
MFAITATAARYAIHLETRPVCPHSATLAVPLEQGMRKGHWRGWASVGGCARWAKTVGTALGMNSGSTVDRGNVSRHPANPEPACFTAAGKSPESEVRRGPRTRPTPPCLRSPDQSGGHPGWRNEQRQHATPSRSSGCLRATLPEALPQSSGVNAAFHFAPDLFGRLRLCNLGQNSPFWCFLTLSRPRKR